MDGCIKEMEVSPRSRPAKASSLCQCDGSFSGVRERGSFAFAIIAKHRPIYERWVRVVVFVWGRLRKELFVILRITGQVDKPQAMQVCLKRLQGAETPSSPLRSAD